MKRFSMIVLCLFVFGCAFNKPAAPDAFVKPSELSKMSPSEVRSMLIKGHPANYFTLAAFMFSQGKKQQGVKWFYVGQIRYRAYLLGNPQLKKSGDPALFSSLMATVGPPLNGYIGGDASEYVATINEAIRWHNDNPYEFFDKDKNRQIYASVVDGLENLKKYIIKNKEFIRKQRVKNGLTNR